ncbi:MAG TPA: protein translocase subunit SecF [Patescibacteria group bacterium]|nr:protein translocase subunit SecF [Patescibacteria group bacterium]
MKTTIVTLRPIWYLFSGILIVASIVSLAVWGLKQGIDFTGGSLLVVRFPAQPAATDVRQTIDQAKLNLGEIVVQPIGSSDVQIRMKTVTEDQHQGILSALHAKYGNVTELSFDAIGPTIGQELRQKSIQGLLIVLAAILIYIAIVFRKVSFPVQSWKYGVVTIFTAFHDVIVPIGVFSVMGHFYGSEIGTPFIAAILTILGYSVTDTVVVMDRIRENLMKKDGTFEEIVSLSVRQTLLRSFSTSMATLLTLIAIHFWGGTSLREFTLTLIIGIAVGTYSSIFIASPLLVTWQKFANRKKVVTAKAKA